MDCEYSNIVNLEQDPELPPQWGFAKIDCLPETLELIESDYSEAQFYLDQKVSYGDILMVVFISIFTIFIITKAIAGFIFKPH